MGIPSSLQLRRDKSGDVAAEEEEPVTPENRSKCSRPGIKYFATTGAGINISVSFALAIEHAENPPSIISL